MYLISFSFVFNAGVFFQKVMSQQTNTSEKTMRNQKTKQHVGWIFTALFLTMFIPFAGADETLHAVKDSFLMQGSANTNEGANPILRLKASGNNRAVVAFDLSEVNLTGLTKATLVLTVSDASTNWGEGRTVLAHRLLTSFTEGNGWNVGGSIRGTGPGVTWKCATDDDVSNQATDCAAAWNGGTYADTTADPFIHTSGMTGEVTFDVTDDIVAGADFGWLIKKELEGQSGQVEYFSREAALAAGNIDLGPRLILEGVTVNLPPTPGDDSALAEQGIPNTLRVKENDSDPNNDPFTVTSVSDPVNGTAVLNPDETITYTSVASYSGADVFTYTVEDNAGLTATGTVTVQVGPAYLTTFYGEKDSYLRQGAPDTNEGGSLILRVKDAGNNRALVHMDLTGEDLNGLIEATLVLSVSYAADNWGDGRLVFAHELQSDWTEGNGWVAGNSDRGTGAGVTWKCASDGDIANHVPDCAEPWDGGIFAPATGDGFVHTSGMTGEVTFDVTEDVRAGVDFGWIVKKELEGQAGRVEYHSRESAAAAGNADLGPRLVLKRIGLGNLSPVAVDDSIETFEETAITIDVLLNDSDPNGDSLTVSDVEDPTNGTASINPDQTITYTPDAGFNGEETFTYTASDGNGGTDTATVTVTVHAGPPPDLVAEDDLATTNVDVAITVSVLANDGGFQLQVTEVGVPANGTAVLGADGTTVTYTPNGGFSGTDGFTYTVVDFLGATDTGQVTVTVEDPTPPPDAVDDEASTILGAPVSIEVLANDTGEGLTLANVSDPPNGSAEATGTSVTYTPDPGFMGTDSFTYTVLDSASQTDTANVTVTVSAPPIALVDDVATTLANVPVTVDALSNDSGYNLSLTGVSAPSNGTAIIDGNSVSYTPSADFVGTDGFQYTVTDGTSTSATANVTVTVNAPPPTAGDDAAATIAATPVTIEVLNNDTGIGLTLTGVTNPPNGAAEIVGSSINYTPAGGFVGTDSFSYTITDVASATATANVTVTVAPPPNVPPVAEDDTATTWEAVSVTIEVLANDTDGDSDPLSVTDITQPANGTTTLNPDDTVTFAPNAGFAGADSFTYTISDGQGGADSGTVSISVNDDPISPTITATVSPEPNPEGWNNEDVTVTFECTDDESGVDTCPDPVVVTTEGESEVNVTVTDRAGNEESVTVPVRLDKTAPGISIVGPSAGRRGQGLTVSGTATDNLGLTSVTITVDGLDVADFTESPFEHLFGLPSDAVTGSFVSVGAVATDAAGNESQATPLSIEVLGGGFVFGEVYDASRGVPLAGATITHPSGSVSSDPLGRFYFFTEEATVLVRVEAAGFTSAERVVPVGSLQGTVLLDARLTPLAETVTVGSSGGTVTTGTWELSVPTGALSGDTDLFATPVPRHGLKAPLPLGWSPVGAVEVGPVGTSFSMDADLTLTTGGIEGLSLTLARYDEVLHGWVAEAIGLTGDTFVTIPVSSSGTYSFVVADEGTTAPPAAVVGEALAAAEAVDASFGVFASSEVTPEAAAVSPDAQATGFVVLTSAVPLPSGTVISAQVEETFESFVEGTLYTEPFIQELPVYRFPFRDDSELHMEFPVTPTREVTAAEIAEGVIHVEITTAPQFNQGTLVGGEGIVVQGSGDAELVVPAGALADTVAVSADALDPLDVGVGYEGYNLLAAVDIDLGGATLGIAGSISVPVAELTSTDNLFVAKLVYVQGQRKLELKGTATYAEPRLSFAGIDSGGTYLFLQSIEPMAFVQGIVRESGQPIALAVVDSSTTPFTGVTGSDGAYLVASILDETVLTARSIQTGNTGTVTITPTTTDTVTADIELATTGPYVVSVNPPDGTLGVALAPSISVTFSEPVEPSTVTATSFTVSTGGAALPGRVVLGNTNRTASFLPEGNLEPVTNYEIALTADVLDLNGNGLLPFNSSFTTLDDSVAGFTPDAVEVSFPDEAGNITVSAPVGSFESGASVMIVNNTNGIVTSGFVLGDGSFSFELKATIHDEIEIRIIDSSEREVVIQKTEFRAEDGSVAIGRKGGTITAGDFKLVVPEGALEQGAVFELTPVAQEVIDQLPRASLAGGFSPGVEIDTGGTALKKEAILTLPMPPTAPEGAEFVVLKKLDEPPGSDPAVAYQVIDTASIHDGKLVTDSYPFPGVLDYGLFFAGWFPSVDTPPVYGLPPGVIMGIARETDGRPDQPRIKPLPGVKVRGKISHQSGRA